MTAQHDVNRCRPAACDAFAQAATHQEAALCGAGEAGGRTRSHVAPVRRGGCIIYHPNSSLARLSKVTRGVGKPLRSGFVIIETIGDAV